MRHYSAFFLGLGVFSIQKVDIYPRVPIPLQEKGFNTRLVVKGLYIKYFVLLFFYLRPDIAIKRFVFISSPGYNLHLYQFIISVVNI